MTTLGIHDGEIVKAGSWIYAWRRTDGDRRVIYAGATGLPPAVRTWLHLHHHDPDIGRVLARFPALSTTPLEVLALRLPDDVSRPAANAALIGLLADAGLLSDDHVGDPPAPINDLAEGVDDARRLVERVRTAHDGDRGAAIGSDAG